MQTTNTQYRKRTQRLDVVLNINHLSYKIPGIFSWVILTAALTGFFLFPYIVLQGARLLAYYMLARFLLVVIFYITGLVRMNLAEKRVRANIFSLTPLELEFAQRVHHVVIIPNFKEPVEILSRTLSALACQENAAEKITVVLAMEKADPTAGEKVAVLRKQFEGQFAHFLATYHPPRLPGEIPGKGSNETWAARAARRELVDELHMNLNDLTITSCDADSIFHPAYFAELTRQFATDSSRYRRFWQGPLVFDNNISEVHPIIRMLTFFQNTIQISELANIVNLRMPLSTYSLSYRLADEVGYWDPAVIAEDWHMFLRCYFAKRGRVRLKPIFLKTTGDAIVGDNLIQTLHNYYQQQFRHAWGATDIGYILQQWERTPSMPTRKKLVSLAKVLHDNMLLSSIGFVVTLGSLLSLILEGSPVVTMPSSKMGVFLIQVINVLGVAGTLIVWGFERARVMHGRENWTPKKIIQEGVSCMMLPALLMVFNGIPILHAQTRILSGSQLNYVSAPKRIGTETNH